MRDTVSKATLREFDLIRWIRQEAPADDRVLVGIGDDAAVVRNRDAATLLTTDLLVEGVHFDLGKASLADVGWKAMARNISDIAAMGGRSSVAVMSAALPRGFSEEQARELVRGALACAAEFDVRLVGGDVSSTQGPLVLSVALLGDTAGRPPVLRSGARPGDAILVTGTLGGSILGKHLRFRPRQAEGILLGERYSPHAMIDISDGFARDLHHILEESGVGARVWASQIPISDEARRAARESGRAPLDHALGDGEDYELLFTLDEADAARLLADRPFDVPVTRVGSVATRGPLVATPEPRRASAHRSRDRQGAVPRRTGRSVTVAARITTSEPRPSGSGSRSVTVAARTGPLAATAALVLPDGTEKPLEPEGWEHTA